MKDEFKLKNVTIVIDQTPMEHKYDVYYLRATTLHSPLNSFGTAEHISEMFCVWLCNTINAMDKNDCKKIKMDLTWE